MTGQQLKMSRRVFMRSLLATTALAGVGLLAARPFATGGPIVMKNYIVAQAMTCGHDFCFNTLSIVSGATISPDAWTVSIPKEESG